MTTYERCQVLLKTAAIVADRRSRTSRPIIAREGSKTITEARKEAGSNGQHPDHLR